MCYFEDVVWPLAIEIEAGHVGPRVAVDYSIRIDHRYNIDLELIK